MAKDHRTRWPRGLLGMLALVAVVEANLAGRPLRFSDTASLSWRLAADAIPREAARAEVACLGDSLVKIGVVPEVIRAGSGLRAYNFAMAQAPAPATYFVLRRLVEAGGRPSAVVVDFKPAILAGGPSLSLRRWQEVLNLREALELGRDSGNLRLPLDILRGRLLASLRGRPEVREALLAGLAGGPSATHQTNRLAFRNWGMNLGNHLNSSREPFSGEIPAGLFGRLRTDDWRCHRVNALYVDRLLELADSRGIPVYWVIPPLPPGHQVRRERSGADRAYVEFVRGIRGRHPGLIVVDGRHSGYRDEAFADPTHLNGRGAMAFSRELAAILGRRDPRGRWVDLPPYRDGPVGVPAEDIDQSRLALESEAARR